MNTAAFASLREKFASVVPAAGLADVVANLWQRLMTHFLDRCRSDLHRTGRAGRKITRETRRTGSAFYHGRGMKS